MKANFIPTTVYLDNELKVRIDQLASFAGKPEAEIVRNILYEGIKAYEVKREQPAKILLDLAEWAEQNAVAGPKDLASRHDVYMAER